MLQFKQIKEDTTDDITVENAEDKDALIPKNFILVYTDDELTEESIPEIWGKLNEHNFDGGAENIDFVIYFDNLKKTSKIIMALYYSEDDSNIPKINEIAGSYGPLFEDFYNKNKPY